jgi:hypothetical protein
VVDEPVIDLWATSEMVVAWTARQMWTVEKGVVDPEPIVLEDNEHPCRVSKPALFATRGWTTPSIRRATRAAGGYGPFETVLAEAPFNALGETHIAVVGGETYWAYTTRSDASIHVVRVQDGHLSDVSTLRHPGIVGRVQSLAPGSDRLYLLEYGPENSDQDGRPFGSNVWEVPLDGTPARMLAHNPQGWTQLDADEERAYWLEEGAPRATRASKLHSIRHGADVPEVIAGPLESAIALSVLDGTVFWSELLPERGGTAVFRLDVD